jgi:hypothetical protein
VVAAAGSVVVTADGSVVVVVGGGGAFRIILKYRIETELLLRATSANFNVRAIRKGLFPTTT